MVTIIHASDIHFGKPFDSSAMEAFRRFLASTPYGLLVLAGDFTQRAKVREYEAARAFLDSLGKIPVVVTPGNHDVPLYRVFERLFAPLRNYRAYISPDLNTVTRVPGATVVALDSTSPHRAIVNGRITDDQLRFAAEAFSQSPPEDVRILTAHHNLIPAPDFEPQQFLPGYQRCISAFSQMGVELILGGHLHRAFHGSSLDAFLQPAGTRPIIIAHSGTATSTRGRARERGRNSLNLIRVQEEEMTIIPHLLQGDPGDFLPTGTHAFPRNRGTTT
jgi:3',5'-cyclic AMP phosphodiesterase CpdA